MGLRMKMKSSEMIIIIITFGIVSTCIACPYLQKQMNAGGEEEKLLPLAEMMEESKSLLRGSARGGIEPNNTTRDLQARSCGSPFCYGSFDWGNNRQAQRFSFSDIMDLSSIASQFMEDDQDNGRCDSETCFEDMDTDSDAGHTFVGQLLSHDMNFDGTSTLGRIVNPESLSNGNTPFIDLDCIYRFQGNEATLTAGGTKFLLSDRTDRDFSRDASGRARIADSRNDEHRILSQITVAMMTLHNQFVDEFNSNGDRDFDNAFDFARAHTIQTWQAIVIHDLLPSLVDPNVLELVKDPSQRVLYVGDIRNRRAMPVEFSTAAYRLIHSRTRASYRINAGNGARFFDTGTNQRNLLGGTPLPAALTIEWENFFGNTPVTQKGRIMDMTYAEPLMRLPIGEAGLPSGTTTIDCLDGPRDECPIDANERIGAVRGQPTANLALLDLARSVTHRVHGGKFCARRLHRLERLKAEETNPPPGVDLPGVTIFGINFLRRPGRVDRDLDVFRFPQDFPERDVPLLLYLSYESLFEHNGKLLGWLGSRIVAETIIALVEESPFSILADDQFTSPLTGSEEVTMVDVLCEIGWMARRFCPR